MSTLQKDLFHLLGDDGYLSLIEAFGGLRIYLPRDIQNSKLKDELDPKYITKLIEYFGSGTFIRVPIDRHYLIMRYHALGMSIRAIARKLYVTEGSVDRALSKPLKKK